MGEHVVIRGQRWLLRECRSCDDPGPHPPLDGQPDLFACNQCYVTSDVDAVQAAAVPETVLQPGGDDGVRPARAPR